MKFGLSIFHFMDCAFGVKSKISLLSAKSQWFCLFLSFIVYLTCLTCKSVIYFEIIFVKSVRLTLRFSWEAQLFYEPISWKGYPSSIDFFCTLKKNHLGIFVSAYFWLLYSISLIYVYIPVPIPYNRGYSLYIEI